MSANGADRSTPALLTTMSIRPNVAIAARNGRVGARFVGDVGRHGERLSARRRRSRRRPHRAPSPDEIVHDDGRAAAREQAGVGGADARCRPR